MFNNSRYATRGVTERIPIELQIFMWSAIDTMQDKRKDYLQVFKLYVENVDGRSVQIVEHTQERPNYNEKFKLNAADPICEKVYVIDDESHSTMLLAEEY
ncbi:DUF960 family protein [Ruminococcus sp.]